MTVEQVKAIRESYMVESIRPDGKKSTRGEYIKLSLDGGIDLVTSKDLVVFDDENEIAHAVCINEDMRSQAMFPVKIISSEYAMIQQIESIMSQDNFESFLKDGFITGLLSDEKKNAMIKWTRNIRNQAQQPLRVEPYFDSNPKIIPKANSVIKREDAEDDTSTDAVEETTVIEDNTNDVNAEVVDNTDTEAEIPDVNTDETTEVENTTGE